MKILLVDDHPVVRAGLTVVLDQLDQEVTILDAADVAEARRLIAADSDIDLVLLDLSLPSGSGFELLTELRKDYSDIPIVVLSASVDPADVMRSLRSGAAGFLPKICNSGIMLGALRLVMSGGIYMPPDILLAQAATDSGGPKLSWPERAVSAGAARIHPAELGLSRRQAQVLALLAKGYSNKAIARALDLAEQTVKAHVGAIFRLLSVAGRTQAVATVAQLGIDLRAYETDPREGTIRSEAPLPLPRREPADD